MKTSFACVLSFSLLAMAACGDDDAPAAFDAAPPDAAVIDAAPMIDAVPSPDARPADVSCSGDTPPKVTVPDPLTVAGVVEDIETDAPIVGATVTARDGQDLVVDTTESAAGGVYQLSIPTGAVPVQGYIKIVAVGYGTANLFAPDPLQTNVPSLNLNMFKTATLDLFGFLFDDVNPERAIMAIGVIDCMGNDVEGAVITISNADASTQLQYVGDSGLPDEALTATTSQGAALAANVPIGEFTVNASINGVPFQSVTVKSFAGQVTLTQIHP